MSLPRVFIPKYRKPILPEEVGFRLRELIREVCKAYDIEILKGHMRPDHVHLLPSVPPTLSPSRVMNAMYPSGDPSPHVIAATRRMDYGAAAIVSGARLTPPRGWSEGVGAGRDLGRMWISGVGVPYRDEARGFVFLEKACSVEVTDACDWLKER